MITVSSERNQPHDPKPLPSDIDRVQAIAGIQRGFDAVKAGRVKPFRKSFRSIRLSVASALRTAARKK
jgi:hypothetical protein